MGYAAYTFALGGLSYRMPAYLVQVRAIDCRRRIMLSVALRLLPDWVGLSLAVILGIFSRRDSNTATLALRSFEHRRNRSDLVCVDAFRCSLCGDTLCWEFLLFLSTGPVNVVIVDVVPIGARALAMAVSIFGIHLLGDAISPPLIGVLADGVGLARAVLIVPAVVGLSGLIWIATAVATRDK